LTTDHSSRQFLRAVIKEQAGLRGAQVSLSGGSKSIPKKNIKMIGGQPLCAWTLRAASNARRIEQVYVSTDCNEIKNVVLSLDMNVRIIDCPLNLPLTRQGGMTVCSVSFEPNGSSGMMMATH